MDNVWSGDQVQKDLDNLPHLTNFVYGRLLPLQRRYIKYAPKDPKTRKKLIDPETGQEKKASEVPYPEWLELVPSARGERVILQIDPKVINPGLAYLTERQVMLGFDDWKRVVLPSIMDLIGLDKHSLVEFANRAASGDWFVEAELVETGRTYTATDGTPKTATMLKFHRMTLNLNELLTWRAERYPSDAEAPVPDADLLEQAKLLFRLAKKDFARFKQLLDEDPELAAVKPQLLEASKEWLTPY